MIERRIRAHLDSAPGTALAIIPLECCEPAVLAAGSLALSSVMPDSESLSLIWQRAGHYIHCWGAPVEPKRARYAGWPTV